MEKVLIEIEMENGDVMKGELYPEVAPITVENFLKLIDEDFFAGLIFHRVIPGFKVGDIQKILKKNIVILLKVNLKAMVLTMN